MNKIKIFDTTLRDGMQGMRVTFSIRDKIQIAKKLDDMKIDYIEGGYPSSSEKEKSFFDKMKSETLKHAKLVSFGSTRHPNQKAKDDAGMIDLLTTETPTVIIVGKTWLGHVERILKTDPEENLEMIFDSISYLKSEGRETFFDLEHFFDGYKDNPDYAVKVLKTASEAGADTVVLCDTNGGMLPDEVQNIVNILPRNELSPLGIHCHNDTGCAVANTLISLKSGVSHVQGTINGWGERCGNANLCTLIPNICLKTDLTCEASSQLMHLTELAVFIGEKANVEIDNRQPYVGEAAFSHKAGLHADVIKKDSVLIEHIDSSLVGNTRNILLSELSGKATIVDRLKSYGDYDKKSPEVLRLIEELKSKEQQGYQYELGDASFDLIIRKLLKKYLPIIEKSDYKIESCKSDDGELGASGCINIVIKNDIKFSGEGSGRNSLSVLDKALRNVLLSDFPFIKNIKIVDYKLRSIDVGNDQSLRILASITSAANDHVWHTIGFSENIIESLWNALVDSYDYYYNNYVISW